LVVKKSTGGEMESVRLRILWSMNSGTDIMDVDQRDVVFVRSDHFLAAYTHFQCALRRTWISFPSPLLSHNTPSNNQRTKDYRSERYTGMQLLAFDISTVAAVATWYDSCVLWRCLSACCPSSQDFSPVPDNVSVGHRCIAIY
jgi:hypothetical protein